VAIFPRRSGRIRSVAAAVSAFILKHVAVALVQLLHGPADVDHQVSLQFVKLQVGLQEFIDGLTANTLKPAKVQLYFIVVLLATLGKALVKGTQTGEQTWWQVLGSEVLARTLLLEVKRFILLELFLSVDVLAGAGDEVIFKLDLILG